MCAACDTATATIAATAAILDTEFLRTTCSFICDTPFPRLWTQVSPLEPAQALHTPVQAEHAAWFDAETHASLKLNVADAVKYSLQRELLSPMKQWLLAYDVLKVSMQRNSPHLLQTPQHSDGVVSIENMRTDSLIACRW